MKSQWKEGIIIHSMTPVQLKSKLRRPRMSELTFMNLLRQMFAWRVAFPWTEDATHCRTQRWLSQRSSTDISALLGLMYKESKHSQSLMCTQDSLEISLSNSSFSFSWVWTTYPVWSVVEAGFAKASVRKKPRLIPSCTRTESRIRTTVWGRMGQECIFMFWLCFWFVFLGGHPSLETGRQTQVLRC